MLAKKITEEHVQDIHDIAEFLFWCEKENPGNVWKKHDIENLVESLGRLTGFDRDLLEAVANSRTQP